MVSCQLEMANVMVMDKKWQVVLIERDGLQSLWIVKLNGVWFSNWTNVKNGLQSLWIVKLNGVWFSDWTNIKGVSTRRIELTDLILLGSIVC